MTREQILSLAKQFQQYPDTKEVTLRGESVVEFAEALLKASPHRARLLDIAEAARLSPYREVGQWDDSLAKLIARYVEFETN